MVFVVLAGLSGLVWGVGDFAGGKATQRASALPVVWVSKLVSLPLLALYLGWTYVPVQIASLGWGAIAGVAGMVGMMIFYRALSLGAMTVVAPVAAVTSAAIPVAVGLARGERPGATALVGVGCALVAIALVSVTPPHPEVESRVTPQLVGVAVASGACFALFFVFLDVANDAADADAGLWPVAASQLAAIALGALVLLLGRSRRPVWPRGTSWRWALVAGPFDMTANALYLVAVRYGDLTLVAPLAALYPVTTVLLALLVDRERLRALQIGGLVLALVALVLVARQ